MVRMNAVTYVPVQTVPCPTLSGVPSSIPSMCETHQVKPVVNDLQVNAPSGQSKAKGEKRSGQCAGDAPVSKKVKTGRP